METNKPFVPPMAQCLDCGGWYATTVGHKCAATTIAAAPAAPAPQKCAECPKRDRCRETCYAAPAPDAVADTVAILRSRDLELPEFHAMQMRVADLIEQQARELAQWRTWGIAEIAIRNPSVMEYMKHWEVRAERAERDRDAAREEHGKLRNWINDAEMAAGKLQRKLDAARAAIAAADADAARYRFLRMSPTQLGWDADYRPDEVDAAIDAARAAMGDGNG